MGLVLLVASSPELFQFFRPLSANALYPASPCLLPAGSWVISPLIWVKIEVTTLMTPLITSNHGPPLSNELLSQAFEDAFRPALRRR